MSEESVVDVVKAGVEEQKDNAIDIKSVIEDNKGLKKKLDELLGETKTAKRKAKEETLRAEGLVRDKAVKEGDFEQLLKSSEEKNRFLSEELSKIEDARVSEKTKNAALKIASSLADGHNAELLSEFVSRRIKYSDGEIRVLDEKGNLTVSSLDDLKADFLSSDKFRSLVRGNKSSGGGAAGSGGGAPGVKSISRPAFEKKDAQQKADLMKEGGTLFDE